MTVFCTIAWLLAVASIIASEVSVVVILLVDTLGKSEWSTTVDLVCIDAKFSVDCVDKEGCAKTGWSLEVAMFVNVVEVENCNDGKPADNRRHNVIQKS